MCEYEEFDANCDGMNRFNSLGDFFSSFSLVLFSSPLSSSLPLLIFSSSPLPLSFSPIPLSSSLPLLIFSFSPLHLSSSPPPFLLPYLFLYSPLLFSPFPFPSYILLFPIHLPFPFPFPSYILLFPFPFFPSLLLIPFPLSCPLFFFFSFIFIPLDLYSSFSSL